MNAQLEALRRDYEQNSARIQQLLDSVAPESLLVRPASGGWSIAENVAHLTLTSQQFLPIIDDALAHAPQSAGSQLHMDWQGRLLRWFVEPPYRQRFPTTAPFEPHAVNLATLMPDFLLGQSELFARLERSAGRAIDRVKITSPFNARLRYNLYSCFLVLAAHQRRHLWQAENVRREAVPGAKMAGSASSD